MRAPLVLFVVAVAACKPEPVLNPTKAKREAPIEREHAMAQAGTVTTRNGSPLDLSTLWQDQRLVVVFFRGHWCPHCQKQLGDINGRQKEIAAQKASVIAISSDTWQDLDALHKKLDLGFEVYSDAELAVISKWGVDDYGKGVALPATFVVEPGGAISYRKVAEKSSDHPTVEEILAAVSRTPDG